MSHTPQALVYDAIRTPRGRDKKPGSLHEVKPIDLVVGLLDELRDRIPTLDPTRIDVETAKCSQEGVFTSTAADIGSWHVTNAKSDEHL